jgi:hypothetical protein
MSRITEEQFIEGYCARSGMSWEELKEGLVVLPCNCGDASCDGWAMVGNHPLNIQAHNELYNQNEDDDEEDIHSEI